MPPAMTSIHPCVKHPAIFPKESNLSALLIKHHHERLQYQGRAMSCEPTVFGFLEAVRQSLLIAFTPPFKYCGMDCMSLSTSKMEERSLNVMDFYSHARAQEPYILICLKN